MSMYSPEDINSLLDFLKQTPEKGLRQMFIGDAFQDPHFRMMLKIAKGCSAAEFTDMFNNEAYGKMRMNAGEVALKETFWKIMKTKSQSLGLIKMQKAA